MSFLEALVLGIIQGLTEFLPVSSSGHLEIGKFLFGIRSSGSFYFSVALHGATVLSTLFVFRKDILLLVKDLLMFKYNEGTRFVLLILVSTIPVLIVGLLFKDEVETLFTGNILFVGIMLMITALILFLTGYRKREGRAINFTDSVIIGLAQALAVLPGLSRSGATIGTGLILGNRKDEIARFSFLMVIIPVIGANILGLAGLENNGESGSIPLIITGFFAAFITGIFACKWMVALVKKSKLVWFAVYCLIVGLILLIASQVTI